MTASTALVRATTVTALVLATFAWGTGSDAAPAAAPTATLGPVNCTDEQGRLTVAIEAGGRETGFWISVVDSFDREVYSDEKTLDPGQDGTLVVPDLDDDDYQVTVDGYYNDVVDEDDPDMPEPDIDPTDPEDSLVDTAVTVACDAAPVGPYANARGLVGTGCGDFEVYASNKPIGGNAADLEPVEFTVTYTPSDEVPTDDSEEPTEEPEEPGDGDPTDEPGDEEPAEPRLAASEPVVLDTFTLDATTSFLHKVYDDAEYEGVVTLSAGDTVVATEEVGFCTGVAADSGGIAGLPSTGA